MRLRLLTAVGIGVVISTMRGATIGGTYHISILSKLRLGGIWKMKTNVLIKSYYY